MVGVPDAVAGGGDVVTVTVGVGVGVGVGFGVGVGVGVVVGDGDVVAPAAGLTVMVYVPDAVWAAVSVTFTVTV